MAAHGSDADTDAVNGHGRIDPQDLVSLGHAFPFFFGLAAGHIFIDPRNQTAGKRHVEFPDGQRAGALRFDDQAINFERIF